MQSDVYLQWTPERRAKEVRTVYALDKPLVERLIIEKNPWIFVFLVKSVFKLLDCDSRVVDFTIPNKHDNGCVGALRFYILRREGTICTKTLSKEVN